MPPRCPGAEVIDLPASSVAQRRRCGAGAKIVFVSNTMLQSGIMRGELPKSVLHQTFASHGLTATLCGPPCNISRIQWHFARHGGFAACVMIKYPDTPVHHFCRSRGALVILDNVDNFRGFEAKTVFTESWQSVDAVLVQTREHGRWLADRFRMRAIVLPHPHGNLNGWGVSRGVRPRMRSVGLLLGDLWRNQPPRAEVDALVAISCAVNVTMYTVASVNARRPISYSRYTCPNATHGTQQLVHAWRRERRVGEAPPPWLDDPFTLLPQVCARQRSARTRVCQGASLNVTRTLGLLESEGEQDRERILLDTTKQRVFYDVPSLHHTIDVGLLWRPGNQMGVPFAVRNRPPTRMFWWWSHGVPVLGYPMVAYAEGAERAGYPREMLNVSRAIDLPATLCALQDAQTRTCLRAAALRGSTLSSPQYSAHQLVAALCEVATTCSTPAAGNATHPLAAIARR